MWRHALGLLRLLWRGRETRSALGSTTGHDPAKEIAGSVANLRGLRLRRTVMLRVLAGAAASLDFALQLGDAILVPAEAMRTGVVCGRGVRGADLLCLHLVVLLLE